jgi:nitroreductase
LLSAEHLDWNLAPIAAATVKPHTEAIHEPFRSPFPALPWEASPVSLRRVIRQRRSAVAMDAHTGITREAFFQMLRKCVPGPDQVPFTLLPWGPRVHLLLFVHRVQGLDPGLYFLLRNPEQRGALRAALDPTFAWEKPEGCPAGLELFRLVTGDARRVAAQVSCGQDIAADGCFSLVMLAEFESPLQRCGAWFYPRLFWECGLLGQVLYLEAEASGVRATGIGCFFDDPVHELLGLKDRAYQDLYHFTVGGAIEDRRLSTLPAYPGE